MGKQGKTPAFFFFFHHEKEKSDFSWQ